MTAIWEDWEPLYTYHQTSAVVREQQFREDLEKTKNQEPCEQTKKVLKFHQILVCIFSSTKVKMLSFSQCISSITLTRNCVYICVVLSQARLQVQLLE